MVQITMSNKRSMDGIFSDLKYLANETVKELESRGYSSKSPERFIQYTGVKTQ